MANPILTLIVEKGPRKGESMEAKTGDSVRIGRVVKGNTFAIREGAISQNHLSFEFVGTRWVVTDLDTSNGTFLNDVQIEPSVPVGLNDGDTIQIGDRTSIAIRISKASSESVLVKEEAPSRRTTRKRGAPEKSGLAAGEVGVKDPKEPKKATATEKGRGASKGTTAAAARASRRGMDHVSGCLPEITENESSMAMNGDLANIGAERTEAFDAIAEEGAIERENAAPVTRGRRAAKRAAYSVNAASADAAVRISRDEPLRVENHGCITEEMALGAEREEDGEKIKMNANMDHMTLGEWFTRMEWYLTKVINDNFEKIISDIRDTARRCNEFIVKKSNAG